ncbi:sugar phosphate nucleotidyltransferase [Bacillus sp. BP-3]|uniref:sugar phosphate nucleotidyltransferase n=1 Tax=Bacillus sp. BP-3 TaxID=3022773 RepID=UPI00232F0F1D|nr:sugar phosphate nucleotidyltransferase [Bacillus sp. BP-3]MDC2863936.1 sugar phosphate nucleotidyltransferase [Bacillus sp. BP-3]
MKLILLSGGSGKRLWPLSNDPRSKQFLKILRNEHGVQESMIQRIVGQVQSIGLTKSTYIATCKSQTDIIQNQIDNQLPLIVEPDRRDTFPAIALASVYLHSVLNVDGNETICIMPVDAYVENSFFESLLKLEQILTDSNASLALMGVRPSHPSEQYGYITTTPSHSSSAQIPPYMKVNQFIEKPLQSKAKELIQQEALWNCGVFAFKLGFLIQYLTSMKIPVQYEELIQQYSALPQRSFDYEVVEKCDDIVVIPYEGAWRDLGTWNTLTEIMDTQIIGNGILSKNTLNTHIINELNLPLVVANICNSIIIASPEGILIADKQESEKIKELINHENSRPMYEEKRWGNYRVLDYEKLKDGNEVLTKRLKILAGKNLSYQMHFKREEVWTIIAGEGELIIDEKFKMIKPGDVIYIPAGTMHGARAITDLEFIEVQMGSKLIEDDILRTHMTWEEIECDFR